MSRGWTGRERLQKYQSQGAKLRDRARFRKQMRYDMHIHMILQPVFVRNCRVKLNRDDRRGLAL